MGHSMGGGALFAAANLLAGTDAIVALAPMNTKPSAIQAAASVKIPTLIFAGANDCITPLTGIRFLFTIFLLLQTRHSY